MHGTQFAQFAREVLQRGAEAVLPQHLPDHWLDALLEEAEGWDTETASEDPTPASQAADEPAESFTGLLGAVLTLLMAQHGQPPQLDIATRALFDHMQLYVMALAAESVSRRSEFALAPPPTIANIFDPAREVQVRRRPLGERPEGP